MTDKELKKKILKETLMKVIDSEETKLFMKIYPTILKTHIKLLDEELERQRQEIINLNFKGIIDAWYYSLPPQINISEQARIILSKMLNSKLKELISQIQKQPLNEINSQEKKE